MRNILVFLLILNGACLGKVKKRHRVMSKAQYEALHPNRKSVRDEVKRSSEKKANAPVKKELVNRDAVCKIVTRNYMGSKDSGSRTNTRANKLAQPSIAARTRRVQETLQDVTDLLNPSIQPIHAQNQNLKMNTRIDTTVALVVNGCFPKQVSAVEVAKKRNALVGSGSFKQQIRSDDTLQSMLVVSYKDDLNASYIDVTDITPGSDNEYNGICTALDGTTLCAGYCNGQASSCISVAKYTNDFFLDLTFGEVVIPHVRSGFVVTNLSDLDPNVVSSVANAVQVDSSNNVYVAGYVDYNDHTRAVMLAKYDKNGDLVTDFGFQGAIVYQLQSNACEAKSLALEVLNEPKENGSNFNLVIGGQVNYRDNVRHIDVTQGLVGKIDPISGDPIHEFQDGGFLAITVNTLEESPITVFNGVAVGSITNSPSTTFTNYIYLAGYAPYLGTNYMLIIELDTNGDFVDAFDQNGVILLDVSNVGLESRATSVSVSRGGPVIGGYWVNDSSQKVNAQASFTYLGVLYAYNNVYSGGGSAVDTQTNATAGFDDGSIVSFSNVITANSRNINIMGSYNIPYNSNDFPNPWTNPWSTIVHVSNCVFLGRCPF